MAHRSARPAAMMLFAWSASVIAPTAMVAMPTSLRMRSANGVWYMRPYTGLAWRVVCPEETSITSQPAALNRRAMATAAVAAGLHRAHCHLVQAVTRGALLLRQHDQRFARVDIHACLCIGKAVRHGKSSAAGSGLRAAYTSPARIATAQVAQGCGLRQKRLTPPPLPLRQQAGGCSSMVRAGRS